MKATNNRSKSKQVKNRKNNKNKLIYNKLILGLCFILISIFMLIFINSEATGYVGKFFLNIFSTLFGRAFNIFFIYFIVIGIIIILPRLLNKEKLSVITVSSLFLSFIIIVDVSCNEVISSFKSHVLTAISQENIMTGSGLIGSTLGYFFRIIFGELGSLIILILLNTFFIYKISSIDSKKVVEKSEQKIKNVEDKIMQNLENYRFNKELKKESKKCKSSDYFFDEDNEYADENYKEKDYLDNIIFDEKKESPNKNNIHNKEISKSDKIFDEYIKNKKEDINATEEINNFNVKDSSEYILPDLSLLNENKKKEDNDKKIEISRNIKIIQETLNNFGVNAKVSGVNSGSTITSYEIELAPGVKVNKINSLSDNLSLALAASDIRILAPIPGKSCIGIEVPNRNRGMLSLREVFESEEFKKINSKIPLALGKDVYGKTLVSEISSMPHLLIAGATGSGKSVCINTIIMSILFKAKPDEVKLILIDPKVVELNVYKDIPHLLIPVVNSPKKAQLSLAWAVQEMENRYKIFATNNVKDIKSYNKLENIERKMSEIVIIIDELADLMMLASTEIEDYICRLAQMARAAGMYLIVATQRPSVDVITGTIKANVPSRISFAVSSQIDSRTILDMSGAEKLLGKGDMLYYPSSIPKPLRLQGAFVSDEEVKKVVDFIKIQKEADYNLAAEEKISTQNSSDSVNDDRDDRYDEAVDIVINDGQASVSYLQRKMKIGYSRAARIIDEMEDMGIVGKSEGSKPRNILITKEEYESLKNGGSKGE